MAGTGAAVRLVPVPPLLRVAGSGGALGTGLSATGVPPVPAPPRAACVSPPSASGHAAAGVGDAQEELQASLVALREALESVRTLADSLERDPSVLLRGPRGDGGPPGTGR